MDSRVEKIVTSFINNGWKLIGSVDISTEWWFDDIFMIESVWNPVEKKLYLTLLVDSIEIKERKIWSVSVSTVLPKDKNDEQIGQIGLNEVKKMDLTNFVKSINDLILR
ncbi:MAG: hypothetical protein WDM90_02305 [Ferruginibacter sp.]